MGNFNNGLGHNGGAHGFKISSLNRLADTKAANGLTWLHYVVKYVSSGLPTPDIQLFVKEIEKAAESYKRESWLSSVYACDLTCMSCFSQS
jgi:cytokinesis protein